jgi:hypothetical protein
LLSPISLFSWEVMHRFCIKPTTVELYVFLISYYSLAADTSVTYIKFDLQTEH